MNHNSYNQLPNHSQTTDWDNLRNVAYDPEAAEKLAKTPLHRKAEIANFLLTDTPPSDDPTNLLSQTDIEDTYRIAIHSADGLNAKEYKFMQQIDTPLGHDFENAQDIFSSLGRQEQKILSFLSGVGFDNYEQSRFSDLSNVVVHYPSPTTLIPQMNRLLTNLAEHNSPAKVQQYVEAFDNFEQKVYGERYEYSKVFDELYHDAESYHINHGWNIHFNTGRPKLLYAPEPVSKSQPLEHSPYHNKALDDQLAAEAKARAEKVAQEQALEAARERVLNKHEAKIINSLMTGQPVTEVGDSVTSAGARETFYGWVNNGQLTPSHESQLLQTIATPMQTQSGGFEKAFNNLSSLHERGILTFASGRGFGQRDQASISDVQTVLQKYPTPVEFQVVENELLDSIRRAPNNPPEKVAEYQRDLETFKQKFYGKREEYHKAWQKLEQEAKNYQNRQQIFIERMQSDSIAYQPPEVRNYIENLNQQQNSTAANYPADRRVIIKSRDPDTTQSETKKGVLGKLFGRKK